MDEIYSEENFRWGVLAYHNGFYNNSILSFEKALSLKPGNIPARTWLGRAFYKSGLEEQALNEWNSVLESENSASILNNWINIITYRRSLNKELRSPPRYVLTSEINANDYSYHPFKRPSAVRTCDDGSFYIVAFGSCEVFKVIANQIITDIFHGKILEDFDHPFDIIQVKDILFISEYNGNNISKYNLSGDHLFSFGETGTSEGKLLGPQYLAKDDYGHLYVTDFGNRRINKYDYDGNFILSIGRKSDNFAGLSEPSGIAVKYDYIYIADHKKLGIYVFDLSGNYIRKIAEGNLLAPEGLNFKDDTTLIISDSSRLIELDIFQETINIIQDITPHAKRLLSTDVDVNGNLISVDFDQNKIFFLSEMSGLFTGYFVQTERIYSDSFPEITIDVSITDRNGKSVIGLSNDNFIITENHNPDSMLEFPQYCQPVKNQELLLSGYNTPVLNIVILVEKSEIAGNNLNYLEQSMGELYNTLNKHANITLISAGETPIIENKENLSRLRLIETAKQGNFSKNWYFDLGIRKAASELIGKNGKKIIIYISQGGIGENSYNNYSLMELSQFLNNNSISFYPVYFKTNNLHKDILYLADNTSSKHYFFFRPEGIRDILSNIQDKITPVYTLRYTSFSDSDFGISYIPIEIESFLMKQSGRDICGYYSPLVY